jgi:predicted acylesterase/phospholipase RssA
MRRTGTHVPGPYDRHFKKHGDILMKAIRPIYLLLWLTGLSLLATGTDVRAAAEKFEPELTDLDRQVPFALAIRGGVSLGAYESGFNWALLQYMKKHRAENKTRTESYIDLKATSGASAGSINALISTISWCVDENKIRASNLFPDRVDDNLLLDTWLDLGFEELLPKEIDSLDHYRADDGVLTRNAFQKAIARIEYLLGTNIFLRGCEVQLGILVTRVDAVEKNIAGVRVHNQRFMIPLRFRVDRSGYPEFVSCLVDGEDPALGNVMYLQGRRTAESNCPIEHDTNDVVDAIEASSAFPLAFGRKFIRHCEPATEDERPVSDMTGKCPDGMRPVVDEFIDGGLFDNIPLGAAKALAEPGEQGGTFGSNREKSGRRFNYIYLDPTIRRSVRQTGAPAETGTEASDEEVDANAVPPTFGIRSQLRFLGGAIASSRDYELYNLLRSGSWTNQVFAQADKLSDAIKSRFPGLALEEPELEQLQVVLSECTNLFGREWRNRHSLDPNIIANANECVVVSAYLLELQYRGAPFDWKLKSANEITRQRNSLIDWIVRLAVYIGEDKLALTAERARNDKLGDRRILVSSRFSPVVGEMMQAFGAFVDRSFREYDYYAGVYDAIWGMASFACEGQFNYAACLPAQIHKTYLALRIQESLPARTVFLSLLRREFSEEATWENNFAWANTYSDAAMHKNMLAIANSLFTDSLESAETSHNAPGMTAFIKSLINEQYDASNSSAFLKRIFKLRDGDELTWYYPLTLRASNRLLLLERQESEVMEGGSFYGKGLALGALYLHSYMQEEEITLNVSTAPDFSWQSWLPDEVAIDARNGGLDLSWYQGHKMGKNGWRWDVKFTPIQLNHPNVNRDDYVWFSQADFFISRKSHGVFSAVGAGPSVSWTWDEWPNSKQLNYGAAMYVGFLEDKLRLTVGKTSFSDEFYGGNYYINFGLNDVPGLVYWGFSGSRGSWWPSKAKW